MLAILGIMSYYICMTYKHETKKRWQNLHENRHQHALERHEQQLESDKQQARDENLSPEELDHTLKARIGIMNHKHTETPADLFEAQLYTLDRVFSTALHQAGMGRQNTLSPEALKLALTAQKQCRQTYALLKTMSEKSQSKQTNEN